MNAASMFREHGISQAEIAEFLGASQGQVSRLLGGKVRRVSQLFEEVCLFAKRLAGGVSKEIVIANDDLISALAETWDGTAGHAKAASSQFTEKWLLLKTKQPFVSGCSDRIRFGF